MLHPQARLGPGDQLTQRQPERPCDLRPEIELDLSTLARQQIAYLRLRHADFVREAILGPFAIASERLHLLPDRP